MLKPWIEERGAWLICTMCVRSTPSRRRERDVNYLGIRPTRCTRRKLARWLLIHHSCGFTRFKR